jgi:hypothetical protein
VLLQRQEQLRQAVGEEKAKEIAAKPELFADAEAFCMIHRKSRFVATVGTLATAVAVSTVIAPQQGFRSGSHFIKSNRMLVYPASAVMWLVYYKIWTVKLGYS